MTLPRITRSLAAFALGALSFAIATPQTFAQSADAQLKQLLEQSAKEFLAAIEGVNDQQWRFKGGELRHSIGEESEHVAFAEQELQRMVQRAMGAAADAKRGAALKGKENRVRELMLAEGKGAENFKPRGRLNSKLEILEYFGMAHQKLLTLLDSSSELDSHVAQHPVADYGDLTARQWFYYIAYHKQRHTKQIDAIKAHADYPGRVRKTSLEPPVPATAALGE